MNGSLRVFIIATVLGVICSAYGFTVQGQEETQTESFRLETEVTIPRSGLGGAFSGGGGPLFLGALLDLSGLEKSLHGIVSLRGDLRLGERGLFLMTGGGGFGGNELRLGGLGGEGRWIFPVRGSSKFNRLTLTLGWGGFLADRLLVETAQGAVSFGLVVGGGSWKLRLTKTAQGSFEDVITGPLSLELNRSFWFAYPFINVEFKVLPFAGLRVGSGFWGALSFEDWKLPDGQAAPGGPLQSSGFPVFQLMIVFGG